MIIKEFAENPEFLVKFLVPSGNSYFAKSIKKEDNSTIFVPLIEQTAGSISNIDINFKVSEVVVLDYDNEIWVVL